MSDKYPFGSTFDDMDVDAFFNMRNWLEDAITTAGAQIDGGGIGVGQADLSFTLNGARFNVSIKPLPTRTTGDAR